MGNKSEKEENNEQEYTDVEERRCWSRGNRLPIKSCLFGYNMSEVEMENGQQDDGLDLSKVLDTLYNKVEANMIETIKKNLGGKTV